MPNQLASPEFNEAENTGVNSGEGKAQKPTPEMQQQFDIFMSHAIKMVYSQKFTDTFINGILTIRDRNKAIDAIADATVKAVNRVEDAALQKGVKINGSILRDSANQIMGEIINIAEMAGFPKMNDDEKAQAFSLATSQYLDLAVKSGKMAPEEVQAISEEAKQTPEGKKIMAKRAEVEKTMPGKRPVQGSGQPNQNMPGRGLASPAGGI